MAVDPNSSAPTVDPKQKLATSKQVYTTIFGTAVNSDLDPAAVLAVAETEGGFDPSAPGHFDPDTQGNPGWSYGPFQMRDPGTLPISSTGAQGPGETLAWSPAGIEYAVSKIQAVAAGKVGNDAITSIVSQFEHPANPSAEIAAAEANYQTLTGGKGDASLVGVPNTPAMSITIPGLGRLPLQSGGGITVTSGSGSTTTAPTNSTATGVFSWLGSPLRTLQLVLGGAMLLLGLYLLAKNEGLAPSVVPV